MVPTVLLFEFEGVLADTLPLRREALQRSFAEDGLALSDSEWSTHCHGLLTSSAVDRVNSSRGRPLDETACELVGLRAERYFADRAASGAALHAGAYTLLNAVDGRSRLAIVTRALRRQVDYVLNMAGLEHLFQCIVTAEDVRDPKPSPDGYRLAMERLARVAPVRADEVLALEDSTQGIAAAVAAGVRCVAVGAMPAWQQMGAHATLQGLEGVTPATLERLASEPTETAG